MAKMDELRRLDLMSMGESGRAGAGTAGGTTVASTNITLVGDDGDEAVRNSDDQITVAGGTALETSADGTTLTIDHSTGDAGDLHTNYAEHDQTETITATWTFGTTNRLQFRDAGLVVYSSGDGQLDIDADTELEITAPTVQIVAGTLIGLEGTTRVSADNELQFRDADLKLYSSGDGQLDIDADTEVEITAPTVHVVASTLLDIDADTAVNINSTNITITPATLLSIVGTARMSAGNEFQFRDDALVIYSSGDGQLDIDADTEVEITAPTVQFVAATVVRVDGDMEVDGDLQFIGTQTISTSADSLVLQPADEIQLDPQGDEMIFSNWGAGKAFESDDYVSQTTGFSIAYGTSGGHADFRSMFANELHVQAFVADIYQAVVGGLIITKSRARLSRDFTVPANTNNDTLYVEDLEGWPDTQLFTADDVVLLRVIDTSGGGLVVADVWGVVTNYSDEAGGEQSYTFTTSDDGGVDGSTVFAGSIALDYGQDGSGSQGVWEATVLDAAGAPYSQVKTWATNPWTAGNWTTRVRIGNLDGISGIGLEYGIWAGQGTDDDDRYFVMTDSSADIRNMPLTVHDGANTVISLDPDTPYISVGGTAPTDYLTGDGFWVGSDGGTYKMHLGDTDGERLQWDGTDLYIYSDTGDYIWLDAGAGVKIYANGDIKFHATAAGTLLVGNAAAASYPKLYYDGTDVFVQSSANDYVWLDADDGVKIYGNGSIKFHATAAGTLLVGNAAAAGYPRLEYDGTDLYLYNTATDYLMMDVSEGIKLVMDNTTNLLVHNTGYVVVGQQTAENVYVSGSGVQLRDGATVYAAFAATTTVGVTTGEHVEITAANGLRMMDSATCRGQWDTDGNVFFGGDISAAASTAMVIVAAAGGYTHNGEGLAQNDILIGDNSSSKANMLWDASAGYLYFRAEDRQMRMNSYGLQMQLYDEDEESEKDIGVVWKDRFSGNDDDVGFIRVVGSTYNMEISTGGDDIADWQDFTIQTRSSSGTTRTPINIDATNKQIDVYGASGHTLAVTNNNDGAWSAIYGQVVGQDKSVLYLDQDYNGAPLIRFDGGASSITASAGDIEEYIVINVNGTDRKLAAYATS